MRRLCLLLAGMLLVLNVHAQPPPMPPPASPAFDPLTVALATASSLLTLLLAALLWVWNRHTRRVDLLDTEQRRHGEAMSGLRANVVTHPELTSALQSLRGEVSDQIGTLRHEIDQHVTELRREVRDGNSSTHQRLDQMLSRQGSGK